MKGRYKEKRKVKERKPPKTTTIKQNNTPQYKLSYHMLSLIEI